MDYISPDEGSFSRADIEARRSHQERLSLDDRAGESAGSNSYSLTERSDSRHRLRLLVIGSGSKGNSSVVYDRVSGEGVLIDAGICKRDVFSFSEQGGFDLAKLQGIFISHSHSDHVKNIGVIMRGLDALSIMPPVYMHERTYAGSKELQKVLDVSDITFIEAGVPLELGRLTVVPISTSHDTEVSFGFRIECSDDALGFITDTGVLSPDALNALHEVRILGLESNHDEVMLRNGPYPRVLKERVASDAGHLSNVQAAAALEELISPTLETVVALHISENNNTYRLPVETLRSVVARSGCDVSVTCAYQHRPVFIMS